MSDWLMDADGSKWIEGAAESLLNSESNSCLNTSEKPNGSR